MTVASGFIVIMVYLLITNIGLSDKQKKLKEIHSKCGEIPERPRSRGSRGSRGSEGSISEHGQREFTPGQGTLVQGDWANDDQEDWGPWDSAGDETRGPTFTIHRPGDPGISNPPVSRQRHSSDPGVDSGRVLHRQTSLDSRNETSMFSKPTPGDGSSRVRYGTPDQHSQHEDDAEIADEQWDNWQAEASREFAGEWNAYKDDLQGF